MTVTEMEFRAVRDEVAALRREMAVREENQRNVERRLAGIEQILSRLTWAIISAVLVAALALVLTGGGLPSVIPTP